MADLKVREDTFFQPKIFIMNFCHKDFPNPKNINCDFLSYQNCDLMSCDVLSIYLIVYAHKSHPLSKCEDLILIISLVLVTPLKKNMRGHDRVQDWGQILTIEMRVYTGPD